MALTGAPANLPKVQPGILFQRPSLARLNDMDEVAPPHRKCCLALSKEPKRAWGNKIVRGRSTWGAPKPMYNEQIEVADSDFINAAGDDAQRIKISRACETSPRHRRSLRCKLYREWHRNRLSTNPVYGTVG